MAINGRKTPQQEIDLFNEQMRANPEYQALIATMGHDARGQVSLSNQDRARVAQWLATKGVPVKDGLKIDPAGNINQTNRLGRNLAIAGAIGAGVLTAGVATGVIGGAAGAAGGAGAAAGGAAIPAAVAGIPAGVSIGGATALGGAAATGLGTAGTLGAVGTGASLFSKAAPYLKAGGQLAGAISQSAAQNRGAETAATLDRDVLAQRASSDYEQALENRRKLELDQRTTASNLQGDAWKRSLQAALAQNWSPAARPEGVANISFVGKGIGEQGQVSADAIQRAAQRRLLNGDSFDELPPVERYTPSALPKTSTWAKLADILGPSLAVAGAFGKR